MVDYFKLLKKRRSIRDFEDKEVSLEIVKEIIKESCLAPSSGNGQPWRFIIINNRDMIKRLSDESKKNLVSEIEKNPDSPRKQYEVALRDPSFNIFYNAPCLIYIAGHKSIQSLQVDGALWACYFMFSATARELGTCWIGLGAHIEDPELLNQIGLPEDFRIVAPIIIGHPISIPAPSERMEPKILKGLSS